MDAFPKNVRAMLESFGVTQQQFGDSIGVSATTVNGWLKRGVQPQRHNLDAICAAYGVTHDDLLSERGFYARSNGLLGSVPGALRPLATGTRLRPSPGTLPQ